MARASRPCPTPPPLLLQLALALSLLFLPACERRESALNRLATSITAANYEHTRDELVRRAAKDHTFLADAVLLASEKLDAGDDATLFAKAVLDAASERARVSPPGNILYVWSLGGLAHRAGLAARDRGDTALARELILAGPPQWRTDRYWQQHPHHDAHASIILFEHGETHEAINRIQNRALMSEVVAETLNQLRRAPAPPPLQPSPN